MKKIFLVLSLLLASQAFASVEDLANKEFELDKKAKSMTFQELKNECDSLRAQTREEFKNKSKEERKELRERIRNLIDEKYNSLSSSEKENFDKRVCKQFAKRNFKGAKK